MHKKKLKVSNKKKTKQRQTKKRGGASFNQPMHFSSQPGGTMYSLNSYNMDMSVSPYHMSSRLIGGRRRKNKTTKKKIIPKKGGGIFGNPMFQDPLLGPNTNSNAVFAVGTLNGGSWIANQLSGVGNGGGPITTINQNGPYPVIV